MKRLISLFAILVIVLSASAQNTKFGKPSQQEWDMQGWGESPDAEAVVLCKTLEVAYTLAGSFNSYDSSDTEISSGDIRTLGQDNYLDKNLTLMTYKVKMRTKILKDSGKGNANVDIVYYCNELNPTERDEITSMTVVQFDKVNGKVKKTRIANFKEDRLNSNFIVRHIAVPNAKEGSIIEYQYEMSSNRFAFLYDWYVQDNIPVMYTQCVMNIPLFLSFHFDAPIIGNVKSDVQKSTIMFPREGNTLQAPKYASSILYTITSRDLVPWKQMMLNNASLQVKEPFKVHATLTKKNIPAQESLPQGVKHIIINP